MKLVVKNTTLTDYIELRQKIEDEKNRLKVLEEQIINDMTNTRRKTLSHTEGDKKFTVTFVQSHTVTFDEAKLKKALGAPAYNKLTTAHLDRKKLEGAVDLGQVDPVVVAQCSTEKTSTPYLRFTEGIAREEPS